MVWVRGLAAVVAGAAVAVGAFGAAPAAADVLGGSIQAAEIELRVGTDGVLDAQETLVLRAGTELSRTFVTRAPYNDSYDRVYRVDGLEAASPDGSPVRLSVDEGADTTTVRFSTQEAAEDQVVVLRYRVHGATTSLSDSDELQWVAAGGYSVPAADIRVTVTAQAPPLNLSCTAGDPASSMYCTTSNMGGHQASLAHFEQARLGPGQELGVAVGYPSGTAPGEPRLEHVSAFWRAFQITPSAGAAFGVLLVALVGGVALLIRVRGRDERARREHAPEGDHAPVAERPGGGLEFRPPDGVHPGQIGTLIDEQADVVDITATIVDLAARGHIDIHEQEREHFSAIDWLLRKRTPPSGDPLLRYEKVLLDALFNGRDDVRVSELGDTFAARLAEVRSELYRDVVRLGWFARRPDATRGRTATVGIAVCVAGAVLTVGLAFFTTYAVTGLAVVIAGAALAVGAQYMPAKTAQGSAVFAHTLGFREYLHRAEAGEVPTEQRVELFSRYLPYAIVFDLVDRWAQILASAGANGGGHDDLPWYHGPADWRLSDFADSIRTFTLTMSGAISATRQFRTLS
ncbi:DUF2207 domain-containing protein [Allonocardiopsis opalescens]|uniref:Putative membrane protein DUF2207 n=1 Tax=Allonocardiopsis opalescens TaxID=1144618 RepID=A0A2T0QA83_9ACTN|nr:DUF2207 domain-containing protein [Allonocardiopsis opalescens]PRY00757.1 putative membrane protein DUF2207 [Allonocardiopsis opalescens]